MTPSKRIRDPEPPSPAPRVIRPADSALEMTRHVSHEVQRMLWGKAAARCEFAGCNKLLCKSSVTQEQVNIAQKAHIYAFSSGGPRGNSGIARARLNDLNNLILVCHECHQKIDRNKDGGHTQHRCFNHGRLNTRSALSGLPESTLSVRAMSCSSAPTLENRIVH